MAGFVSYAIEESSVTEQDEPPPVGNPRGSLPRPYSFFMAGITIGGILYIKEPSEESFTEGSIMGLVAYSFWLDRRHPEVHVKNRHVGIDVKLDLTATALLVCSFSSSLGHSQRGEWRVIARW